jgi:hypothetical protein
MPNIGSSLTERERARITSVQTEDVDFGFADAGDQDYADQDSDQEGDKEEEEEEEEEENDDAEDIVPTTRETGKHTTIIIYIHYHCIISLPLYITIAQILLSVTVPQKRPASTESCEDYNAEEAPQSDTSSEDDFVKKSFTAVPKKARKVQSKASDKTVPLKKQGKILTLL